MIDLVEVIKITDDLIQEFELKKVDKLYECYLKNLKIGYAVIYKRENNMLYLTLQNNTKIDLLNSDTGDAFSKKYRVSLSKIFIQASKQN